MTLLLTKLGLVAASTIDPAADCQNIERIKKVKSRKRITGPGLVGRWKVRRDAVKKCNTTGLDQNLMSKVTLRIAVKGHAIRTAGCPARRASIKTVSKCFHLRSNRNAIAVVAVSTAVLRGAGRSAPGWRRYKAAERRVPTRWSAIYQDDIWK